MGLKDIMHFKKDDSNSHPVEIVRNKMNKLFDDVMKGFFDDKDFAGISLFSPKVDIEEDIDKVHVSVELPGMNESDIELAFINNILLIKGEKKLEKKTSEGGISKYECSYGEFRREIPVSSKIKEEEIEASFKNGILNVVLKKAESELKKAKKIEIKRKE